ncbi:NACHT, LRR and PYD domains-containing protein 1 homolog isoform X2 [Alosa pseudoharengus]
MAVGKPSPAFSASCSELQTRTWEVHDGGFPKIHCERCAHVSESRSWGSVYPEVSTGEDGSLTFCLSSASGAHQCSRSGVRWECNGKVSLQYRYVSWGQFREKLAKSGYKPAGPLMNIKVFSGKLEKIHLPHYVCIRENDVKQAMKILHGHDGEVSFEICEVGQFHATFCNPSFSPLGPVIIENSEQAALVHCKLLHYRPSDTSLVQRTYLIPADRDLEDRVRCQEKKCKSMPILVPDPEKPLRLGDSYSLTTMPKSTVTPQEMILRRYDATPNFYKVAMRRVRFKLKMTLTNNQDNTSVWEETIQKDDFGKTNTKSVVKAAQFVDRHRLEIIDRVCLIRPIADELLRYNLINDEKVSDIMSKKPYQNQMRRIYDFLKAGGRKGKAKFYEILQKHEPTLIDTLTK